MPAKPGIIKALQPDGTTIDIILQGNSRHKRMMSPEGKILTTDSLGFYVYIEDKENTLGSDSYLKKDQSDEDKYALTRGLGLGPTKFPSTGEHRSLVILVEFADKGFSIENPRDYYERMLNEPGFSEYESTGSARDYFLSNSGGKFSPYFDVYGPVVLSREFSYYGRNDMWGQDANPHYLVIEACELMDEEIDFSLYDSNSDGYIDNVYVFYAGYGEADGGGSSTIWPHSWDISEATKEPYIFDGVRLDHYACSNELQKREEFMPDGIGTFCHEFSHVLGLPDLYSTTYSNAFTPGDWSILDTGSYNNSCRTPPNYSAYERYALDWISPEYLQAGEYTLSSIGESNEALIIFAENDNEYFLFENRQPVGFDSYLPGHGMLIWHIDYNVGKWWNNVVNNTSSHQNVDLVEADNLRTKDSVDGDSFPGASNVTEYSCETLPAFSSWNKESMPFRIYDISESETGIISFKVEECERAGIKDLETNDNMSGLIVRNNVVYAEGKKIDIYNINGVPVSSLKDSHVILARGFYILKSDNEAYKIFIP